MVETYTPKPLQDRNSQKLTLMQYIWDQFIPKWGMTLGGLVGGWFLGGIIGGATGAKHGRMWGNQIGSIAGGLILGFTHWRKDAANEMDTAELASKLRDVMPMAMTEPEIKTEITNSREMLTYEQRENARLKALAQGGGKTPMDHATADTAEPAPRR